MQLNCTITVSGNRAYLEGYYPLDLVRKTTSFPVQGAHFSKAFKKGRWDGRKHLFDLKMQSMPAGHSRTTTSLKRDALSQRRSDVGVKQDPAPELYI